MHYEYVGERVYRAVSKTDQLSYQLTLVKWYGGLYALPDSFGWSLLYVALVKPHDR